MDTRIRYDKIDPYYGNLLKTLFTSEFRSGYVSVNGVLLPEYFLEFVNKIQNFEVRNDDVWICSYPKTGTTWTQEMAWCIGNDLDYETAKQPLQDRCPFLEHTPLFDYREAMKRNPNMDVPDFVTDSVKYINEMPSPRYIKTHLPWSLLPSQIRNREKHPKIIYVTRNAKDTCVSYYHHTKLLEGFQGTFEDFVDLFLSGKVCFGSIWDHMTEYWVQKENYNILYLTYEDMKSDLRTIIHRVCKYMEKTLSVTDIDTLCQHLSFNSMKNNKAVNYEAVVEFNQKFGFINAEGSFMRSGTVGNHSTLMSQSVIDRFNYLQEKVNIAYLLKIKNK